MLARHRDRSLRDALPELHRRLSTATLVGTMRAERVRKARGLKLGRWAHPHHSFISRSGPTSSSDDTHTLHWVSCRSIGLPASFDGTQGLEGRQRACPPVVYVRGETSRHSQLDRPPSVEAEGNWPDLGPPGVCSASTDGYTTWRNSPLCVSAERRLTVGIEMSSTSLASQSHSPCIVSYRVIDATRAALGLEILRPCIASA